MSWEAAAGAAGGAANIISGAFGSKTGWSRQKRMMQKRHQWEVSDLRKAGLNPILSAGAAPSMAGASGPTFPDMQQQGTQAINRRQNKAERNRMRAQKRLMGFQGSAQQAQADLYGQQALESQERGSLYATQNRMAGFGLARAELDAEIARSSVGRAGAYAGAFAPILGAIAQGVGAAGLWRLRGAAGPAKSTTRTPLIPTRSTGGRIKHPIHIKSKGPKTETWTNPKYNRNRYP